MEAEGKKEVSKTDQLRAEIKKDMKEREQNCAAEIEAALKKYNCDLVGEIVINEGSGYRFVKRIIPK